MCLMQFIVWPLSDLILLTSSVFLMNCPLDILNCDLGQALQGYFNVLRCMFESYVCIFNFIIMKKNGLLKY